MAAHENGRPAEAVKFTSGAGRLTLPEREEVDELGRLRQRIRSLFGGAIPIKKGSD